MSDPTVLAVSDGSRMRDTAMFITNESTEPVIINDPVEEVKEVVAVDVHTQEEMDQMSSEEKLGVLKNYSEVIDLAAKQSTAHREVGNVLKQRDEMQKYMKTKDDMIDPMELINQKLATVANADVLAKDYLPYPDKVAWFFTNDETGELIDFDFPDDSKIGKDLFEFQKDMLLFFKRCDDAIEEYNKISQEAEEELKEINADINQINALMGNNVLAFVDSLMETTTPDNPNYKQVMEVCEGIQSAYNFSMIFETLEKYPSVIRNTLEDFKRESRIKEIGAKYGAILAKSNTSVNLVTFLPRNKDSKSIEQQALAKFYRAGTEDLFIFIMIRWFSMNRLETVKVKKFHAALYLVIYQLMNNQLPDDAYDMVMESAQKLLAIFYDQMPNPAN